MNDSLAIVGGILLLALLSVRGKKLTPAAGISGAALAIVLQLCIGFSAVALLGLFFTLGVAATRLRRFEKLRRGQATESEQRGLAQVWANGGVAMICAFAACLFPMQGTIFFLALAGSLSSAAADTVSSELGVIYGRRFINILSGKPDQCGRDGVISLEGTLWGAGASLMMGMGCAVATGHMSDGLLIAGAGIFGNFVDSLLGAAFERRGLMNNELVNFLNTLSAAALAGLAAGLS